MSPQTPNTAESLRGQTLHIPNLQPAFAAWKQGINPAHARVRQAVDARLAGLIGDETVLAKVRGADIGLFAAGYYFPPFLSIFFLGSVGGAGKSLGWGVAD